MAGGGPVCEDDRRERRPLLYHVRRRRGVGAANGDRNWTKYRRQALLWQQDDRGVDVIPVRVQVRRREQPGGRAIVEVDIPVARAFQPLGDER